MEIIVQKYGGSSVSSIEKIKKIADKIKATVNTGKKVVVVISAMGKTTNQLIEMAKEISGSPNKREMDMLFSTGERTSMALLCIALNETGLKAISLTGSQAGIITNAYHNNARVIEVRPFRIEDELLNNDVVVVGGFQGVSYKRDITTLGRGGSDTSAVALAAALNATQCEIYSDVDGVYTSDPQIITDAKHIPELSYQQMQEMSNSGAKVLNAQAVEFAKLNNIAIYARSTFGSGKETIIRKISSGVRSGVKAVVYEKELIKVVFSNNFDKYLNLLNFLNEKGISSKEHYSDSKSSSCIISTNNIVSKQDFITELEKKFPSIEIHDNLGSVSIIGDGLNNDISVLQNSVSALNSENIVIEGFLTTSFRISILLKNENVETSLKILHKLWIE